MDLSTIILMVLLLGAICGMIKPFLAGISGLVFALTLSFWFVSSNVFFLVGIGFICSLLGVASGLACHILFQGIKCRRPSENVAYMGGFGVHHPGGIILSDKERDGIKCKNINREILISY